jgi:signal transduction histidine kinase
VIVNLCNNAFDAMREKANVKGETADDYHPKLTVKTARGNGQVIVEIEDNGPGIPKEIRNKILQPFFTTKKGTEGTGLGLSITNDIIKAHGGRLDLKSTKGEGTIFVIELPLTGETP